MNRKKSVFLIVTIIVISFLIACSHEKDQFKLTQEAQINSFDSDNIFGLKRIIEDEGKLIYMFEKENNLFSIDKIYELSQEKKYNFVLLGEKGSTTNIDYQIIEEKDWFYLYFKYDEKDSKDKMLGFKINIDCKDESFSIFGIENPHLSYWNYNGEFVNYRGIDEWVYGSTLYEEYDDSKEEWINYGKNYISSFDEPR